MKTISTDEMNDIISGWVDADLPINPAGYEDRSVGDAIKAARGAKFVSIVHLPDDEFRALYRAKTGREIGPMNFDGSYTEVADEVLPKLFRCTDGYVTKQIEANTAEAAANMYALEPCTVSVVEIDSDNNEVGPAISVTVS